MGEISPFSLRTTPRHSCAEELRAREVSERRLTPEDLPLFNEAKARELSQFLHQEALRKVKDQKERDQAHSSGRIMSARWVLTWKLIPEGERQAALDKRAQEGESQTTIARQGDKKAKARLVIIGFQHPDLGTAKLKTASPVLGQSTRQLLLAHAAWKGWRLESCDASSAFLQLGVAEEENEI